MKIKHSLRKTEIKMTEKGWVGISKLARGKEIRHTQKKMNNCMYINILFIYIMVTMKNYSELKYIS